LYTLTNLTGRRAEERRVVPFATFEATARTWRALAWGATATAATFACLWWLLGAPTVLVAPLVGAAVTGSRLVRSRRGMQRLWVVEQMDRHRSSAGRFFVCGMQVDPDQADLVLLSRSSLPPGFGAAPPPVPETAPVVVAPVPVQAAAPSNVGVPGW
jgi:hypothetical protein